MNESSASPASPTPSSKALVLMFLITLAAVAVVVFLLLRPAPSEPGVVEEVIPADEAQTLDLHRGDVVNAMGSTPVSAEEGRRYYAVIQDASRDGASGVARIGGMVTFVRGAQPGEHVVIEVSRVKRTTAEANVVERLSAEDALARFGPPTLAPAAARPRETAPAPETTVAAPVGVSDPAAASATHTAIIREVGRHGDGIAKLEGKVVFLAGTEVGDQVTYVVEEDRDSFAIGRVLTREKAPPEALAAAAPAGGPSSDEVVVGAEFTVTVVEKDRKLPDVNGVARIGGLVVFVPGTQPGDVARVRIVERAARFARSELIEKTAPPAKE